eukprot:gnl/TRDRNA2_/TRDRNA2_190506_c0_seq1.p1 gnl/TRDRNA2_/TRDRNA2_190506_c0~~gnl/TRDRNA2_/TRDRNA2_190506_c0_seq1.p1  ORF type:complete len:105 (+),score=8.44 gnl/TRDRNA2_/TRDRNA2_190506_c0_seq1:16-330(+)
MPLRIPSSLYGKLVEGMQPKVIIGMRTLDPMSNAHLRVNKWHCKHNSSTAFAHLSHELFPGECMYKTSHEDNVHGALHKVVKQLMTQISRPPQHQYQWYVQKLV